MVRVGWQVRWRRRTRFGMRSLGADGSWLTAGISGRRGGFGVHWDQEVEMEKKSRRRSPKTTPPRTEVVGTSERIPNRTGARRAKDQARLRTQSDSENPGWLVASAQEQLALRTDGDSHGFPFG